MADTKSKEAEAGAGPKIQETFLKERKIFLWGEVSDKSARDITEKLLYLEADAPGKEITFYINTPGGSITAGMAVYDTMKLISSPIKVIVTGMAASIATSKLKDALRLSSADATAPRTFSAVPTGTVDFVITTR